MNILMIEDDDLVAATLARQLSRRGHLVTRVDTIGPEVIKVAATVQPDLVLTDRDVIGGDAWIFVREAVQRGQLPDNVIFMSGRIPEERPERFWLKGGEPSSVLLEMVARCAGSTP